MEKILFIDKPKGITSFDVIRRLKRRFGSMLAKEKMGHAGTLDPLATGLLIIAIGDATKDIHKWMSLPKTYEAEALVGVSTDTGDIEGEVLNKVEGFELKEELVREALNSLVGDNKLKVPIYSAVKKDGKPLYWYARKGIEVNPPVRNMRVNGVEFLGIWEKDGETYIKFSIDVESGVYVRSLIEELGRRIGVPMTMSNLRRVKVGEVDITGALKIEDIGENNL